MSGTLAKRLDRLEKNYLMNGGFSFWQRGGFSGGVNAATSLTYVGPDRWRTQYSGTHSFTPNVRRNTSNIPDTTFPASLEFDYQRSASAATLTLEQRIESLMVGELSTLGFASFSVWVYGTNSGSIRLTLLTPTIIDNHATQTQQYQSTQSITGAVGWQQFTFPAIPMASATNLGLAVRIEYVLASGTDGSAVSWGVSRAMLNGGKSCADFQPYNLMYDAELTACQRYACWANASLKGEADTTTLAGFAVSFPVPMRAIPAVSRVGTATIRHHANDFSSAAGVISNFSAVVDSNEAHCTGGWMNLSGFTALTQFGALYDRGTSSWLFADADL